MRWRTPSSTARSCAVLDGRGSALTRARARPAGRTRTRSGRPRGILRTTSKPDSSWWTVIGGSSVRPWDTTVRRRSTGSPPGPRSASEADQALSGQAPSGELPDAIAQEGHGGAAGLDAVDLDVGRTDHEVGVRGGVVQARRLVLLGGDVVNGPRDRASPGDVRGRVLVVEGVAED